ncbi:hypothetical protein BJ508DRAFT_410116 [Ascobolus immersus RN42]|uniref:Uncharacterized protein n=1 Tax=Ascobolus immersus RN42 TaxID=1160509 RepID=A0A3N4IRB0_ASCIM|nr:hypothetical protein BJ508DRAFT_410116 [Ascobolus immersus RN42]
MPNNNEKDWSSKLVGKKYQDGEVAAANKKDAFTKSDLPAKHRIIEPDTFYTSDFVEDRLNVHLDDKKVCTKVKMG